VKNNKGKIVAILVGAVAVHFLFLLSLKFTAWPEMTLWPYLITKGWLPYRDIAIAHTPLLLIKLAIFYKIFGVGILQLKIFTWILILGLDILVFGIARKLWNLKTALVAAFAFIFWQLFFDGNGLWFDLFMGVFTLVSYYFVQKKKYLWAGIFWALAFISKQTAVWFLLPIGLEIAQGKESLIQSFKKFIVGAFLVAAPSILILWLLGILPDFYNWGVRFGIFILPKAQGQVQLPDLKNLAVSVFPFLIFVPLIWRTGRENINLLIWAIAGCLGAYPRFEYFHLQPSIPFLAIATGIFFSTKFPKSTLVKTFVIFYVLGSIYLFGGFFMRNFKEGVRFYETDVRDVVTYVKSNTNPGDKIFVMNWWDNIYPLTDTLPATDPWVPQLSWYLKIPGIQEKMVEDLEISKPKIILLNAYSETGLSAYVPEKIYSYVALRYKISSKVDGVEILVEK
jgi:hypothetical protein